MVEGHPPPIGDAIVDDRPGLLLIMEKQPEANTVAMVPRGVEAALARLAANGRRPGMRYRLPPSSARRALSSVPSGGLHALVIGCLLVALILAAFLYDARTAVISALAIPLSLLAAVYVLRLRGGPLDTMGLAGLAIALGEVVDDAVVDVKTSCGACA